MHGLNTHNAYRYGFNGMERDDEVSGAGNSYTAQFWQFDARLGKRWNIDPILKSHESPYASFANNPIMFVDPVGLDTFNVVSGSTSSDGSKYSSKNALVLFTVYSNDDRKKQMTYNNFRNNYQTVAEEDVTIEIQGAAKTYKYAKVLDVNSNDKNFTKSVSVVSLSDLQKTQRQASSDVGNYMSYIDFYKYFRNGGKYDLKKDFKMLTYVKDIGIFPTDYLGNMMYSGVVGNFYSTEELLDIGDGYQKEFIIEGAGFWGMDLKYANIDDPMDSYAIFKGKSHGITKESLSKTNGGLIKKLYYTSHSSYFYDYSDGMQESKKRVIQDGIIKYNFSTGYQNQKFEVEWTDSYITDGH